MRTRHYSPRGKVDILLSRGWVLSLIGETARAQEDAKAALGLARQSRLLKAQAECLMMMASVHDQLGEMQAMRQEVLAALELYRRLGDHYGEGQATGLLGIAMSSLEGPQAARPYYERALAISRTLDDRRYLMSCLLEMGWILIRTREYESAKRHLQEGLDLARSENNLSQVAFGTSSLGEIALHQGRPEEALGLHQQALAVRQRIGDKWFQGITWSWLSADWHALGDLPKARAARERALAINRAIGIRSAIAHDLGLLSELCEILGELDLALAHCQEALDFSRRCDEEKLSPSLLCRLSSVHFSRGDWEAAGATAWEVLSGDSPLREKALAALILARITLVQGDRILAFGRLQEAREWAEGTDQPELAFLALSAWAELQFSLGDVPAVRGVLERMHGLLPNLRGKIAEPCLACLAACLLACEGKPQEAEAALASALSRIQDLGLRWEEARACLRFGKALGREPGKAYLKKAEALFSELGAPGWAELCAQALKS